MKKSFTILLLLVYSYFLCAVDRNLVIIVDNLQQETAKSDEVTMTHQCMTALQQQASMVLISTGLWKNIVDRKKRFAISLQDPLSLQSNIFHLYQTTNQQLKSSHYNLSVINQKLSPSWFEQNYPSLAHLPISHLNQLRFDFACYIFEIDFDWWQIYDAHAGMLLFVPRCINYQVDENFAVIDLEKNMKHAEKKSYLVESLQKLLLHKNDRFLIYLTGHGHPKSAGQQANIAGLKIDDFRALLDYFDTSMQLKLLVYSSCYGGGVHTVEPYASLQLHYPVIVTAATDAPIFGFGLFEGVKLPPYNARFLLEIADVSKKQGLLPYALQNYGAFFKRAWKGQFDLNLVQLISKFFTCDLLACHVQKIENFPLIRKVGSLIFVPIKDNLIMKLIQQVTGYTSVTSSKPLLLYTKKVKKIKIDRAVPIISMLPGLQSHTIDQLIAPQVLLSQLLEQSLLSLEDMQTYKNFFIKKLTCINDLVGDKQMVTFDNFLIVGQGNLRPKFLDKLAQVIIYCQLAGKHYLLLYNDQKVTEQFELNFEQIDAMRQILGFVQLMADQDAFVAPEKLLTFDAYCTSKEHQQTVVDICVKKKVCKKTK